ncbi:MAG: hypothetical protein HWQ38_18805 [Nostoc sp. NMS7]|uniref:hypothetical protein n=1 Tax=Nostoc sp. NMS7 TaxID=2815391 RepID=UPI0025FD07DF|nr:hypothetical protein [Nostoc sp. NMS7]MBN3948386.1 hypothetical protein [Nostoc sp. NMS7]
MLPADEKNSSIVASYLPARHYTQCRFSTKERESFMAIAGLTNKDQTFNSLGRVEVKVFKGTRKQIGTTREGKEYEGYGNDLGSKLRITSDNRLIRTILNSSYGPPDANGDFLTEELRVYFPFDEVERTFATSMSAYKGSGLEIQCDRTNILKKCVMLQDSKGQYRQIVDCNAPCPMQGKPLSMKCDRGCNAEGQLFFYVKELLDKDLMIAGRIALHSLEDVSYVDAKLREFKEMLGTITNSPFPCWWYRHKVPFILSRTQVKIKTPVVENKMRTGKRADKVVWAIALQVDPEYMELRRAWMELEERSRRQLPVSQSVVKGLLRGDTSVIEDIDAIDVEVVEVPAQAHILAAAPLWMDWKSPQDAIAWAIEKLPLVSEDQLWQQFNDLEPINGKKAPAWFSMIESVVAQQKYAD